MSATWFSNRQDESKDRRYDVSFPPKQQLHHSCTTQVCTTGGYLHKEPTPVEHCAAHNFLGKKVVLYFILIPMLKALELCVMHKSDAGNDQWRKTNMSTYLQHKSNRAPFMSKPSTMPVNILPLVISSQIFFAGKAASFLAQVPVASIPNGITSHVRLQTATNNAIATDEDASGTISSGTLADAYAVIG